MHLRTILNRVANYKSFVFAEIEIDEMQRIIVAIEARKNGRPVQ
jgi:hypothetical protein